MTEIINQIKKELPPDAMISDINFEGANIVLYTKNQNFLLTGTDKIKEIVSKIKKRIELRMDPSMIKPSDKADEIIRKIIPKEAEVRDIWFDEKRAVAYIEALKPGLVIGKKGSIIQEIKSKTLWTPVIRRAPAIKSDIVDTIRRTLFHNSEYRRNFLHKIGERIYEKFERDRKYWVRISCFGGFREVGRSAIYVQTPISRVLLDCGVNIASEDYAFPRLEAPEFNIKDLDAVIVTHAHLDHSGFVPYLYKFGYRGPVYSTEPTRDIMTMLQLDYINVMQKDAKNPIYSSKDIHNMIKHSVSLNYNEVTDITKDIRITLVNAGHVLGSSMVHLNIGDGFHNILYTGDLKYAQTKLLDKAHTEFQRLETLVIESTYGGPEDTQPPLEETEKKFVDIIKKTIERGGKVLVPVLGVGRAQEIMLIVEEAYKKGKIPKVPVIVDGMVWDITAIHTAYPEFFNSKVREKIFKENENPFTSDVFRRIASKKDRDKLTEEEGPAVILATSGMLTGGPSVYYLYKLADNKKNSLIFVSYQGEGSLGRKIQKGEKEINVDVNGKLIPLKIKLEVHTLEGFSGHSDKDQLINFVKDLSQKPRRIIVNHGESSKCLNMASTFHKMLKIETNAPRNLDALRIR